MCGWTAQAQADRFRAKRGRGALFGVARLGRLKKRSRRNQIIHFREEGAKLRKASTSSQKRRTEQKPELGFLLFLSLELPRV